MFSLRRRRLKWYEWSVQDDSRYWKGKSRKLFRTYEDGRTRKHALCLKIRRDLNSNIGLKFFTRRVISYWNQLTDEVVSCKALSAFKIKLYEFMTVKGKFKFNCIVVWWFISIVCIIFIQWVTYFSWGWVDRVGLIQGYSWCSLAFWILVYW